MSVGAVIFDLDNTLLETDESAMLALEVACDHLEFRVGLELPAAGPTYLRIYYELERSIVEGRDRFDSARQVRVEAWRRTLSALDQPVSLTGELVERYAEERRRQYRLYQEVPEVLDAITARWPCAILTNGFTDIQREKVEAVGLCRWTPDVLISGEIGAWKPDPAAFQAALRAAGCHPEQAVMVGDSLNHDIAGAAGLGMPTVWINRRGEAPAPGTEPAATLEDLSGLADLVRDWDGR